MTEKQQAWLLTERRKDGREVHVGIALTYEAKAKFMRGYFEEGEARTAIPYPILESEVSS